MVKTNFESLNLKFFEFEDYNNTDELLWLESSAF